MKLLSIFFCLLLTSSFSSYVIGCTIDDENLNSSAEDMSTSIDGSKLNVPMEDVGSTILNVQTVRMILQVFVSTFPSWQIGMWLQNLGVSKNPTWEEICSLSEESILSIIDQLPKERDIKSHCHFREVFEAILKLMYQSLPNSPLESLELTTEITSTCCTCGQPVEKTEKALLQNLTRKSKSVRWYFTGNTTRFVYCSEDCKKKEIWKEKVNVLVNFPKRPPYLIVSIHPKHYLPLSIEETIKLADEEIYFLKGAIFSNRSDNKIPHSAFVYDKNVNPFEIIGNERKPISTNLFLFYKKIQLQMPPLIIIYRRRMDPLNYNWGKNSWGNLRGSKSSHDDGRAEVLSQMPVFHRTYDEKLQSYYDGWVVVQDFLLGRETQRIQRALGDRIREHMSILNNHAASRSVPLPDNYSSITTEINGIRHEIEKSNVGDVYVRLHSILSGKNILLAKVIINGVKREIAACTATDIYVQLHIMFPNTNDWVLLTSDFKILTGDIEDSAVYEAFDVNYLLRRFQEVETRNQLYENINVLAFNFIGVPRISNSPFLLIGGKV